MPKYRKKPIVIEAFQWEKLEGLNKPGWFEEAFFQDKIISDGRGGFIIKTLEGEMKAEKDDYIICGIKGEIYPCKPDIFEATYEEVNNE